MKLLNIATILLVATLAYGCNSSSANEVDEYLDAYEEVVENFANMVESNAFDGNDPMAAIEAVNNMNEKNMELSKKAEQLQDMEWTAAQQTRQLELANRFNEVMVEMQESLQ
jgi:hypothetical protein